MEIEKDRLFTLAERYVEGTSVSVFLTGKAGTGKTTFLKEIVRNTSKRCAIVAPTGVAAINAGGVTIHSFFQLPLCPYLPDVKELVTEYQLPENKRSLKKDRVKVLRTLDLLIIDEISMVRADIMDAMDSVLRRYRHNDSPFGGVQLLMIGDIQQLPPVVKDEERHYMEMVYPSPFFFNAKAMRSLPYIVIELEKIHRQTDREFMDILNDFRGGKPSAETLARLNSRLNPKFEPPESERWIRLTTHNAQADRINESKMNALEGEENTFEANIDGTFPANAYPADTALRLKVGAQVMFIRNDTSGQARYYNGKLGTIKELGNLPVVEDLEGNLIEVDPETWENTRYEIDKPSGEIRAVVEGTFSQLPLRLAWAITIHKSQGLTFDRVIIDAGYAFSFGQVYVALSRCRTLEGIVLSTKITEKCAFESGEVANFEDSYTPEEKAASQLNACEEAYYVSTLCDAFDLTRLRYLYNRVNRVWQVDLSNLYPSQAAKFQEAGSEQDGLKFLDKVAQKFHKQIGQISASEPNIKTSESATLRERVSKACEYFSKELQALAKGIVPLLMVEIDDKEISKSLRAAAEEFLSELRFRIDLYANMGKNGFSIKGFNNTKVTAELSEKRTFKALAGSFTGVKGKATEDNTGSVDKTYSDNNHPKLVKALTAWRTAKCRDANVPAYCIMHQKTLLAIADAAPLTKEEFLLIKGFSKRTWTKYGEELLEIVENYISQ